MNYIVRTKSAIYSPCQMVSQSSDGITVTYFAGMKKDKRTGEMVEDHKVDTISRNEVVSLQKRT